MNLSRLYALRAARTDSIRWCDTHADEAAELDALETELTTSEGIRAAVAEILTREGVTYAAAYVGETQRDKWACDAWRVTIGAATFDYFTGLGLRDLPAAGRSLPHAGYVRPGTIAAEENARAKKPVPPDAASVLHALTFDAAAASQSFDEWCDEYGADNDSIKAFNDYRACCETAKRLRAIFGPSVVSEIADIVAGY